jgi:hypothetical protein
LLLVALAGGGIAGLIAVTLVSMVGWLGILIIGLAICLIAALAKLDAGSPAMSVWRCCADSTSRNSREERRSGSPNGPNESSAINAT